MEEVRLISRCLYRLVDGELGTEKVVDMRRRIMALEQCLRTTRCRDTNLTEEELLSGSRSEGLRFASSDWDWMFICRGIRVMFSLPTHKYNDEHILLMAERNETKPGFALLRAVNNVTDYRIREALIIRENRYYVACKKWRDLCKPKEPSYTTHGPCSTIKLGQNEVDYAFCFKSDTLPEEAHGFIRRLQRAGWPSASTLKRIASGGCHFVAIGAKESPTEDEEWRISFSETEKILIHSMNHVQFLCYGLLKIFLKEAININKEIKELLCSYFLKTALFWEIATNSLQWNDSNFLRCFWTCFQRLLHWINNEYCPNFFIPENNMFFGKVRGADRTRLLSHLLPLFHEGYNCLLRCPSISDALRIIIQQPIRASMIEIKNQSEKCNVDVELILEVFNGAPNFEIARNEIKNQIQNIDIVISENHREFELEILQLWRNYLIQNVLISSCIEASATISETAIQIINNSMTTMPVVDATRHLLYTALYYYRRSKYSAAISVLQQAKVKLQHPHLCLPGKINVEQYRAAGGEHKPLSQTMKEIVAWPVDLKTEITMTELTLENQRPASQSEDIIIIIPPLVFTNFMSFLCFHHMGMIQEAINMLQELSILVQYDNDYHIYKRDKAISWQILGICQEMRSDYLGAYKSFRMVLQQICCDAIKSGSLMRISCIIYKRLTGQC